jgi:hypothetical protein
MTTYDNTNRGALFRNTRKEQDSHPDHTGNINVDGREFWLSAWIKVSKDGKKFFSLQIKPKDGAPAKAATANNADMDYDIPF